MISAALALAYSAIATVPASSQVLSEAMSRYYYAMSISGTIDTTIKTGGKSEGIKTRLQISSPDKFYIEQYPTSNPKNRLLAICDGAHYAYPLPRPVDPNMNIADYLVEPLIQKSGVPMDYRMMYSIISETIVDRSIPLEIAVGRDRDLQTISSLLSNFADGGMREYNGETVRVVLCNVRPYPSSSEMLKGAFFVNEKSDIRFFKTFGTLHDDRQRPFTVETDWVVNLKVNEKDSLDKRLFDLALIPKK